MRNTIARRVYDFLKKYPPFDIITEEDLLTLSKEVVIIYLEKGKVLLLKMNKHIPFCISLRKGLLK
ncbi:hypothetical protein CCAN2_1600018 [Capnocytophaga canimorsus]|nr:hypothetical protein [Capnocytophaga canimorsus]CEN45550.1 hypothetical protein CCAN2_1600018 [Capnocytophaga canimorsus]